MQCKHLLTFTVLGEIERLFTSDPNNTQTMCYFSPQNIQLNTEMAYCHTYANIESLGVMNKSIEEALPKISTYETFHV